MRITRLIVLWPICLALGAAAAATGQEPNGGSGVVVLKYDWSKERIGWERDPFGGVLENNDEMRARTRNERRIEEAKRGANDAEIDRMKREARADAANIEQQRRKAPARYYFVYRATVQNQGPQTVQAVDWDYVFYDSLTRQELGRHQLTSEIKIGPGQKKKLEVALRLPPTATVSVSEFNSKEERAGFSEQVTLTRVAFTDGTVWRPE